MMKERFHALPLVLTYLVALLAIFLLLRFDRQLIDRQFLRTFEKKSLDQLAIYHESNRLLFNRHFVSVENLTSNLASDSAFAANLESNRLTAMEIMKRQRLTNNRINSLLVLDASGKLILGTSVNLDQDQGPIGQDYSFRPYFQNPAKTLAPYWSDVYQNVFGNNSLAFSLPIVSPAGKLRFVLVSVIYLSNFAEKYQNYSVPAYLGFVLVDKDGNLISDNGKDPQSMTNIKSLDRAVEKIINFPDQSFVDEEINYQGKKVLVRSSSLETAGPNTIHLVSYYDKDEFTKEQALITAEHRRLFYLAILAASVIGLVELGIILYLNYRHEKKLTD